MKEILLSDMCAWVTIVMLIALYIITRFIFRIFNRILRHRNIMKHGYPPPHCDADGDFKEETEE